MNLVIASLIHSRVTINTGPTTKDTITGTFTSMLRFSETIVAFEGVSQLEDWIHFRRRQNTFNSRIDICTWVAKSRDRISGGGRWILADLKSRDGEWPMADFLLHIGTGTCTVHGSRKTGIADIHAPVQDLEYMWVPLLMAACGVRALISSTFVLTASPSHSCTVWWFDDWQ